MKTATSRLTLLATLAVAGVATMGCGNASPRQEDGPLPRTPASASLQRMRVWIGSGPSATLATKWQIDGQLMWPTDRVGELQSAIEAGLHEDLNRMQAPRPSGGRRMSTFPATYVQAAVVSLSPDIAIVSVGHISGESKKPPFEEWATDVLLKQYPVEYIGPSHRQGDSHPQGNLGILTGPIAPFADEMYVVSPDQAVPIDRIRFENDTAKLEVQNAFITLRHTGSAVQVDVEYR